MDPALPVPLVGAVILATVVAFFAAAVALEARDCPATAACFWIALVLSAAAVVVGLSAGVM